jgi:lysophospholipase L1-like esterase
MRHRAVVVLGLFLAAAAGCGGPSAVSNPRVLLIGDSIMSQARAQTDAALRGSGWQPVVAAVPGSRIEDWPVVTANLVARQQPAIAVVELGTNNCSIGGGCTDLQALVDQVMGVLGETETVLWLNVQEDVALTDEAQFVNSQLDEAASRWPKMKIVDFNGDFEGRPELNIADQIHLTDPGKVALAQLIDDSLEPYLPSD